MRWRQASRRWKAKGYTLTEIADKIEETFGKRAKLGRSTVGILVTTEKEEVPPAVLEFLEGLPILDQEKWAEYLDELAKEPSDEVSAAPTAVQSTAKADQSDAKLDTLTAKADQSDAKLDALTAKADQSDTKLDALTAKADQSDTKLDAIATKTNQSDTKLDAITRESRQSDARLSGKMDQSDRKHDKTHEKLDTLTRSVWWVGGALATAVVALVIIQSQPPSSPVTITVNAGGGGGLAEGVFKAGRWVGFPFLGAYAGKTGEKSPPELYVPKEPLPGQKRGNCNPKRGENLISGGCWVPVAHMAPPCGELYRYGNECYRPVAEDPDKPVGSGSDQSIPEEAQPRRLDAGMPGKEEQ